MEKIRQLKYLKDRNKFGVRKKQSVATNNLADYLETDTEEITQINLKEVKISFQAGSSNLFDFLQGYEQQRHELVKVKLQEAVEQLSTIIHELDVLGKEADEDLQEFDSFIATEVFSRLDHNSLPMKEIIKPSKGTKALIQEVKDISFGLSERFTDLCSAVSKFLSNFSYNTVFRFQTNLIDNEDYLRFAENFKVFLEEDKIDEYEKRTTEHFASLIIHLGKETMELLTKLETQNRPKNTTKLP